MQSLLSNPLFVLPVMAVLGAIAGKLYSELRRERYYARVEAELRRKKLI